MHVHQTNDQLTQKPTHKYAQPLETYKTTAHSGLQKRRPHTFLFCIHTSICIYIYMHTYTKADRRTNRVKLVFSSSKSDLQHGASERVAEKPISCLANCRKTPKPPSPVRIARPPYGPWVVRKRRLRRPSRLRSVLFPASLCP